MPNKQDPFDERDIQQVFEEARARAAKDQADQSGYLQQLTQQQAFMQQQLAQQLAQQQLGQRQLDQQQLARQQLILRNPLTVYGPLTEASPQVSTYLQQIEAVRARQQRLGEALELGAGPAGPDREAEAARIALGAALTKAVTTGLLSEQRAVDMVVAGGINNKPMTPEEARVQVRASLAQALAARAISPEDVARIDIVLDRQGMPTLPRPAQGQPRPTGLPPDAGDDGARADLLAMAIRNAPEPGKQVSEEDLKALVLSVPELLAQIDRLEDLLYTALTIRPCHLAEHVTRHQDSPRPCAQQASVSLQVLLDALDAPPTGLPRAPHLDPDGARAACCARDGNLGTWLLYGQTLDPAASFSGDAR